MSIVENYFLQETYCNWLEVTMLAYMQIYTVVVRSVRNRERKD